MLQTGYGMIGAVLLTMYRTISNLSIVTAALLAVLLPIAPVGDFPNIDALNDHTLAINSSLLPPPTGVLVPSQSPRVWVPGGTKQRPSTALAANLLLPASVRRHSLTAELDLTHTLEPAKCRKVSDRSPPVVTPLG